MFTVSPPRDASWDFLRGTAILAVLGLHACAGYMALPLAGLLWPARDPAPALAIGQASIALTDVIFWICRGLAVPLFCFVAGVLAAQSLARTGRLSFTATRLKRLGVPLLAGALLILPAMYFIWAAGWAESGLVQWKNVPRARFGPAVQPHLFGFAHLWYLWYALLYSLVLAAVWPWVRRWISQTAGASWPGRTVVGLLALVCLGGVCCWALPTAVIGFKNTYLPVAGLFLYHALFFAWGVASHRSPAVSHSQSPGVGRAMIAGAVALGVALAVLIAWDARPHPNLLLPSTYTDLQRLLIGVCATLQALLMISGLRHIARCDRTAALSAVGRSSLWIYSTHLIWMGLAILAMRTAPMAPELKAVVVFVVGLALPALMQPIAARTCVGRWLGARRSAMPLLPVPAAPLRATPSRVGPAVPVAISSIDPDAIEKLSVT